MLVVKNVLHTLGQVFSVCEPRERFRHRVERAQGIALEISGHAVEYIVDEERISTWPRTEDYRSAISILCRASKSVYEQRETEGI